MKQYFKVSFKYSEYIYCANIAHAETAEDVKQHYSKYEWVSVNPAHEYDVELAREKGMPFIEIEPAAEPLQRKYAPAGARNRAEKRATAEAHKKPVRRVNAPATLRKMMVAIRDALTTVTPEELSAHHVTVTAGNEKVNGGNVSTAPVWTCTGCCGSCAEYCYAVRSFNRQGNGPDTIRSNPWFWNTAIMLLDRDRFFREIAAAIAINNWTFFRWHVSGEITDADYFARVAEIAEAFPAVRFLIFTKQHGYVRDYLDANGGQLPRNLKTILSAAPGLPMVNPYGLPEAHINFADPAQNTCQHPAALQYRCPGKCEKCQQCGAGCWFLENGAAVVFDQH